VVGLKFSSIWGFDIDSVRGSFGFPASKMDKVSSMAQALLRWVR
jgi:hypothetical protein